MADFTSHAPGTFSWPELSTTDQKAAVAFYKALFGWGTNDVPMGPTEVYSIFQMRGKPVGAAATQQADERKMGVPPHWNAYVAVADVDESAKQAVSLGGRLLAGPFDVMDAGRMAVIQDPTGAVFQLWTAKRSIGAEILNEPGALCWTELNTRDTKAAEAFYTKLFGWTAKHSAPGAPMEYTEFKVHGQSNIGMMPMVPQMPKEVPSYWMPYFQVTDTDASVAKVTQLGGKVMVPPTDIPNAGRFAIVGDPQGAVFAVFTMKQG